MFVSVPGVPDAASLGDIAKRTQQTRPGIFASREYPAETGRALPQWRRVARSLDAEIADLAACIDERSACDAAGLSAWRNVVLTARGRPTDEQVRIVNDYFNRWPYKTDREVHGRREYWATPLEFMAATGDCEDYAIAKFATLKFLGVPENRMRIVVIFDRIRQIRHAVLAYYAPGETLILDSLSDGLFGDEMYTHYRAEYSLTTQRRWMHVPTSPR